MLAVATIEQAVHAIATQYPIKRVALFGSYAEGNAGDTSDVDVLVEFAERPITLLDICGFQQDLSEQLNTPVDVLEYPFSPEAEKTMDIQKVIPLYEKQG